LTGPSGIVVVAKARTTKLRLPCLDQGASHEEVECVMCDESISLRQIFVLNCDHHPSKKQGLNSQLIIRKPTRARSADERDHQ
jgi:hypothetical protein